MFWVCVLQILSNVFLFFPTMEDGCFSRPKVSIPYSIFLINVIVQYADLHLWISISTLDEPTTGL